MATVQQLNDHATEFTSIEEVTLSLWLDLDNADLEDLAAEVARKGLQWEHFTSLLPSDPNGRSPEMMVAGERLRLAFEEAAARGRNALKALKKETATSPPRWLWDPEFGRWRQVV
jgi:hypothetical protein